MSDIIDDDLGNEPQIEPVKPAYDDIKIIGVTTVKEPPGDVEVQRFMYLLSSHHL